MALLERENFLADMTALYLQAASGEGRVLFLGGEAGIGKSALLREFSRRAASEGARVLQGACDSLSTPRPLGPLLDMALEADIGLDISGLTNLDRHRSFTLFLRHLKDAAAITVVIFEDVHWADEATLDLLRFLGRRVEGARALLIASFRDDEVGAAHPLRLVMGELATHRHCHRMALTPLSLSAVAELAVGSGFDADELQRRTGGNPFYVTEVLAAGGDGVPERVADAVLARVARLSTTSRAVLDVCAVAGFRFAPDLIAEAMESEADTRAALEECGEAGVLVASERTTSFRHELARDALLAAMSYPRQQAEHRRIFDALVAGGSQELSGLAHHAEGAGDREAVLAYAPAAARAAAWAGAHTEAASQLGRALRFAAGLPPAEHASLLEEYARQSGWIDRPDEAERALLEALRLRADIGDDRARVIDLARLSQCLMSQGRNRESDEAADTALRMLETVPPGPEHAYVLAHRAYLAMLDRHNDTALVEGKKAIALAREFRDPLSLINAYNAVGSALILESHFEEGERQLRYSLRLAQRCGDDNVVANAYGNLGSGLGEMYRFASAEAYLRRGIAYCRERDADGQGNYMEAWLALTRMYVGDWDEATVLANGLLRLRHGAVISRIMALIALGRVRARRGDPEVWSLLDEALALADETATLQRVGPVRAARAEARFLEGDEQGAAREAAAAAPLARQHRHLWHMGELTYWQRESQGEGSIAAESGELGHMARPFELDLRGDWSGAARAWEELGCPYEMARSLSAAVDEGALRRAREVFARLGAAPMLARVEGRMHALGFRVPRGPTPATLANPAMLTRREAQIVRLLAEGLTNQEIAGKLYRSVRTVDHHVSSILSKLDVDNRVAAVQKAARLGLLD